MDAVGSRKCPLCAELIPPGAVLCPYCGAALGAAPPPPPPPSVETRTDGPMPAGGARGRARYGPSLRRRSLGAVFCLAFAGLAAWSAFLPWVEWPLFGETHSGWDIFQINSEQGLNRMLIGSFFREGLSPFFTGLPVLISAVGLGLVGLVVLAWPRSEPPNAGRVPTALTAAAVVVGLAAFALPMVNMLSLTSTATPGSVLIGYGMGIWVVGACGAALGLVMATSPSLRPPRPPGTPWPRRARLGLQILLTFLLIIGFLAAVVVPCGLEETSSTRSACLEETDAWKIYLGIGAAGALLGITLTWATPAFLRRRRAGNTATGSPLPGA